MDSGRKATFDEEGFVMIRLPRRLLSFKFLSFGVSLTVNHGFYLRFCELCFTLMEFMYFVFTRMPGESYRRRLGSLLLYLCDVLRAVINSLVCWLCFTLITFAVVWALGSTQPLVHGTFWGVRNFRHSIETTLRQHSAPQLRSVWQCKLFLGEVLGKRPLSQFPCTSVFK